MTEKAKNRMKTAGLIAGAAAGGAVNVYVSAALTALCPPVGIVATVGKWILGTVIATKCADEAYDTINKSIAVAEATEPMVNELKEAISAAKETSEDSEDEIA